MTGVPYIPINTGALREVLAEKSSKREVQRNPGQYQATFIHLTSRNYDVSFVYRSRKINSYQFQR